MDTDQALDTSPRANGYIGRFAPSPTGPLHFGSLVTAVASYADARAAQGAWLLRIEDVDTPRCSARAEREIRQQLAAFGFEHDGAVERQSERGEFYELALQEIARSDRLFACTCTRKMLEAAPRNRKNEIIYPGTCRASQGTNAAHALRIRVPESAAAEIGFADRRHGAITQNLATEVGDFVLRRADGLYAYQLAVVIDDARQSVTDVVRGDDLLLNTPRQIFLQRALGYPTPHYLHVPLVLTANGEKLSKQTQASAIRGDSAPATLRAAWQFLRQDDLGPFDSVADFWRQAVQEWSPDRLRQQPEPS